MPGKKQIDDLPIEAQDVSLFELRLSYYGYVAIIIILLFALIGLFGKGIFGKSMQGDFANGLVVKYDKTLRIESDSTLEITAKNVSTQTFKKSFTLSVPQAYLQKLHVKQIIPQPLYARYSDDKIIYYFWLNAADKFTKIIFLIDPIQPGLTRAAFELADGTFVSFNQFIYP